MQPVMDKRAVTLFVLLSTHLSWVIGSKSIAVMEVLVQ